MAGRAVQSLVGAWGATSPQGIVFGWATEVQIEISLHLLHDEDPLAQVEHGVGIGK